jgi:O-succinylbenzoic acid--CoA ligase
LRKNQKVLLAHPNWKENEWENAYRCAPWTYYIGSQPPFHSCHRLDSRELEDQEEQLGGELLFFSSGSSGAPKAIAHDYKSLETSARESNHFFSLNEKDRTLVCLPQHHMGGFLSAFRAHLLQGESHFTHPDELSQQILQYKPSIISLVPTLLYRLCQQADILKHLKKMKLILLGGSACPHHLISLIEEENLPAAISYGLTESAGVVMSSLPGEKAIIPLRHNKLSLSQTGQLSISGESLARGYYHDGQFYPFSRDFKTPDFFHYDGKTFRYLKRGDLVFISGGENIDPLELEMKILEYCGIEQSIVVPIPHPEWGHIPVCFLEKNENVFEMEDFRKWLTRVLIGPKRPRAFYDLPNGEGIKPKRSELITLAIQYWKREQ